MKWEKWIWPLSWIVHCHFARDGKYSEMGWAKTPHSYKPSWVEWYALYCTSFTQARTGTLAFWPLCSWTLAFTRTYSYNPCIYLLSYLHTQKQWTPVRELPLYIFKCECQHLFALHCQKLKQICFCFFSSNKLSVRLPPSWHSTVYRKRIFFAAQL